MWNSNDIDYHLTPNGWIKGTSYFFGNLTSGSVRPADCVLTLRLSVRQTFGFSGRKETWSEIWKSRSAKTGYVAKLQKNFPRPQPGSIKGRIPD
ncbi:MAG: hypothetical protein ABSF46_01505 [Terriglobia bacterium]|jgi:hypothetical protein